MKRHTYLIFLFLIVLIIVSGCKLVFTQEQVNATVVAKIKEVSSLQRVYVTVETVIVKEYVMVTPTVPEPVPYEIFYNLTTTPLGFIQIDEQRVMRVFNDSGAGVNWFNMNLNPEETNGISTLAASAKRFSVSEDGKSYGGRIFLFDQQSSLEQAYASLQEQASDSAFSGNRIFVRNNVILELDAIMPYAKSDLLEKAFNIL